MRAHTTALLRGWACAALLTLAFSACNRTHIVAPFALGPSSEMNVGRLRSLARAARQAGYLVRTTHEREGYFDVAVHPRSSLSIRVQCYRDGWVRVRPPARGRLSRSQRDSVLALGLVLQQQLDEP